MSAILFGNIRRNKNLDEVCRLIDQHDIHVVDEDGRSMLHSAVAHKRTEICKYLLQLGVQTNHQDKDGLTALHFAAIYQQPEIAKLILENGGDLSVADKNGNQPLFTAAQNSGDNVTVAAVLIEYGADPTVKNNKGFSAQDLAERYENEGLLKLISCKK